MVSPARAPRRIELGLFDAFLFDLDGVVTRTAGLHAAAWKRLFDEYLADRAAAGGTPLVAFDAVEDYLRYVDGRPRAAGVESFLAARGMSLPAGRADDGPEIDTLNGLGSRKDGYFTEVLEQRGVEVFEGAVRFIREARARGMRTAIVSSSRSGVAVLDAAGVSRLFDARVDGVDLERLGLPGKPAPDSFLEAARRLETRPGRAAVFEDALVGVEAGRAGRFRLIIGVGRGDHAEALRARGADMVVGDLGELILEGGPGGATPGRRGPSDLGARETP